MNSSIRILVAEDESDLRELLREFLAEQGYTVSVVPTGADALAALSLFEPDVLLVDMLMPGLSGQDVVDAMRRRGCAVPAILMTGTPTSAQGFFSVLEKPFKLEAVAEVVAAAGRDARTSGA